MARKSIYDRTEDLFTLEQNGESRYVAMRLEDDYCGTTVRVTSDMTYREASLMRFALRRRVADFASSIRRSRAKLAEVVEIGAARG